MTSCNVDGATGGGGCLGLAVDQQSEGTEIRVRDLYKALGGMLDLEKSYR